MEAPALPLQVDTISDQSICDAYSNYTSTNLDDSEENSDMDEDKRSDSGTLAILPCMALLVIKLY